MILIFQSTSGDRCSVLIAGSLNPTIILYFWVINPVIPNANPDGDPMYPQDCMTGSSSRGRLDIKLLG